METAMELETAQSDLPPMARVAIVGVVVAGAVVVLLNSRSEDRVEMIKAGAGLFPPRR